MTSDHEAREAAAKAVGALDWGAQHGGVDPSDEQIANAAIDAYNAKLREGVDEPLLVRAIRRNGTGVVEYRPDSGPKAGTSARSFLAEMDALSAQRQDHTKLIAEARDEGARHVYTEGGKCSFARDGDPCPYNPYREAGTR